jgi:hypothetical protein
MRKNTRNWIASILSLLMVFAIVMVLLMQGRPAAGGPSMQGTASGPDQQEILQLKQLLASEDLSDEARRSLEEKLEMAERLAAQRAGTGELRSTKVAPEVPPVELFGIQQQGEPEDDEGIYEGSEGIIRPSLADINNVWQGTRGGMYMQVFAGSFSEMRGGEGVVIVIDLQPDHPSGPMTTYPAPAGAGALRILEVGETAVVLTTESGERLEFNLISRTFE